MKTRIIVVFVLLLLGALLVGRMVGFGWAGGKGFEWQPGATVSSDQGVVTIQRPGNQPRVVSGSDRVRRGEMLSTDAGGRALLQDGDASRLYLDERTDVVLDSLDPFEITLLRGRILVAGQMAVRINRLLIKNTGTSTLVHYDFSASADLIPIRGDLSYVLPEGGDEAEPVSVSSPTHVIYYPKVVEEPLGAFKPYESSRHEFYERFIPTMFVPIPD
ncbi:hypothetical protein HYV73_04985 [Candidatus Uhrbacteria bacterium]|nr:hypothetical protein [Candidatus Uhrbacteria bacterium]